MMGMRPGAVTSLAHRAREGLRQAYLDQHVVTLTATEGCTWTRRRLSQYVRHDLSARAEQKVVTHLDGCAECSAAYLQVDRINQRLAAWLFPVVLLGVLPASGKAVAWLAGIVALPVGGSAVPGGTAAGGAGTTGAGSAGAAGGLAGSGLAVAGTVAALAAVAAVGVVLVQQDDDPPRRPEAVEATPSPEPTAEAQTQPRTRSPHGTPGHGRATTGPALLRPAVSVRRGTPEEGPGTPEQAAPPDEQAGPPDEQPGTPPAPPPASTVVQAVAPTATPICGNYGSLQLPTTRGVTYVLSAGDGKSGSWQVDAAAQKGYVLRAGTASTFTGDLHSDTPCTSWAADPVTMQHIALDTWDVRAVPEVVGGPDRTISVRFDLTPGLLEQASATTADGWSCHASDGSTVGALLQSIGFGLSITCDFAYTGVAPPPITLRMRGLLLILARPSGTVTLLSDGQEVATTPFA